LLRVFVLMHIFSAMLRPPPLSTPLPYTTLFRSRKAGKHPLQVLLDVWTTAHISAHLQVFLHRHPGQDGPAFGDVDQPFPGPDVGDRKSTRLNSSHVKISYAVFCLKKKKTIHHIH